MQRAGSRPFDMLSAVVNWVEKGTAPDSVIATDKRFRAEAAHCAPIPSMPSTREMATVRTH